MNNTITNEENICELKRSDFQREINGKQTDLFILKNDNGAEVAYELWWSIISHHDA